MISKEEMYDFASQIAGITDADLQQYKCGGKTKKNEDGAKMSPAEKFRLAKQRGQALDQQRKAEQELRKEKQEHPERFDSRGNRIYTKSQDTPTNEDQKPNWKSDIKPKKK